MNNLGNGLLSSFIDEYFKHNILVRALFFSLSTGFAITCLINFPFIGPFIFLSTSLIQDAFPELANSDKHMGLIFMLWIYLKSFFAWFVFTISFSIACFPFYLFREVYIWFKVGR